MVLSKLDLAAAPPIYDVVPLRRGRNVSMYGMRAVGIGWQITGGLMFLTAVNGFRLNWIGRSSLN